MKTGKSERNNDHESVIDHENETCCAIQLFMAHIIVGQATEKQGEFLFLFRQKPHPIV